MQNRVDLIFVCLSEQRSEANSHGVSIFRHNSLGHGGRRVASRLQRLGVPWQLK